MYVYMSLDRLGSSVPWTIELQLMPFSFPIKLGISNLMFVVSLAIRLGLLSRALFVLFFIPSFYFFETKFH